MKKSRQPGTVTCLLDLLEERRFLYPGETPGSSAPTVPSIRDSTVERATLGIFTAACQGNKARAGNYWIGEHALVSAASANPKSERTLCLLLAEGFVRGGDYLLKVLRTIGLSNRGRRERRRQIPKPTPSR